MAEPTGAESFRCGWYRNLRLENVSLGQCRLRRPKVRRTQVEATLDATSTQNTVRISLIAAAASNGVIGIENQLPWHMPADLMFFRKKTVGHHILMGSRTFQSIGRPLPNRMTLVVSSHMEDNPPAYRVVRSIEAGINFARCAGETELFVVGGASIYRQTLSLADRVYLTEIQTSLPGDAYFPRLGQEWMERSKQSFEADARNAYAYAHVTLERKR